MGSEPVDRRFKRWIATFMQQHCPQLSLLLNGNLLARFQRAFLPGFTNPRWLATLRSPGANPLHASGVQTAARKGCADSRPGLSEAIPRVIATLYTDAR